MKAVTAVCNELIQISLVYSAYYPLCSFGRLCIYAKAVEKLLHKAASVKRAEELVELINGRIKLEELNLPEPALEVLTEELGPEPPWLDALAASFFRLYLGLHRQRRIDGRDLAFALCLWAQKKRRENPTNPLWRTVELKPDRLYTEKEAREMLLLEEHIFRRLWRRANHGGEKVYGHQLILAALSLMAVPPR